MTRHDIEPRGWLVAIAGIALGVVPFACTQPGAGPQGRELASRSLRQATLGHPFVENAQGALERTSNGLISGWAFDPGQPDRPATVDIYLDGVYNGSTPAATPRSELSFLNCTGKVGFEYAPVHLGPGARGSWAVQAYLRNGPLGQLVPLPCTGDCRLEQATLPTHNAMGNVDTTLPDLISGWAFDPRYPNAVVLIYLDGELNGLTLARHFRPGQEHLDGSSHHGFSYQPVHLGATQKRLEVLVAEAPLDQLLSDLAGDRAQLSIDDPAQKAQLSRIPRPAQWRLLPLSGHASPILDPPKPSAIGFVERASARLISGWAFDRQATGRRARVRLRLEGKLLAEAVASIPRPLPETPSGAGDLTSCGFELPVQNTGHLREAHLEAFVLDTATGLEVPMTFLQGTSSTVLLPAPNITGVIEQASEEVISGWVYDPELGAAGATVRAFGQDGLELGTATAHLVRPDLARANGSGANLGFQLHPKDLGAAGVRSIRLVVLDRPSGLPIELPWASPSPGFITVSAPEPLGALEQASCERLSGWAFDPRLGARPTRVDLFLDGVKVGVATADRPRSGLRWLDGEGRHGFEFWMPDVLTPGVHQIVATYVDERTGQPLTLPAIGQSGQVDCPVPALQPPHCP